MATEQLHRASPEIYEAPLPIPVFLSRVIGEAIVRWEFPPGYRLKEQELERMYETSRGPVREALRLLELRGLVEHAPRRGFRVKLHDSKEISDIYHLRADLEAMVIDQLRGKDLDSLLVALEESNQRMGEFRERGDTDRYLAENVAFHRLLRRAAANRPLSAAIENLTEIAQPLRYAALSQDIGRSSAVEHHKAITTSLGCGDFEAARAEIRQHILENLPNIKESYSRKLLAFESASKITDSQPPSR